MCAGRQPGEQLVVYGDDLVSLDAQGVGRPAVANQWASQRETQSRTKPNPADGIPDILRSVSIDPLSDSPPWSTRGLSAAWLSRPDARFLPVVRSIELVNDAC